MSVHLNDVVKVVNPHNPDDYIIIKRDEFKPGEPHAGHGIASMQEWKGSVAKPAPARSTGEPPAEYPQSARLAELKLMTVAVLGPEVEKIEDSEFLVRLLDIETRVTARAVIEDQLAVLEAAKG